MKQPAKYATVPRGALPSLGAPAIRDRNERRGAGGIERSAARMTAGNASPSFSSITPGSPDCWNTWRPGVPRPIITGEPSAVSSSRIGRGIPSSRARLARASRKSSVVGTRLGQFWAQAPQSRQSSILCRKPCDGAKAPSTTASRRASFPRAAIPSLTVSWYRGHTAVQAPHLLHRQSASAWASFISTRSRRSCRDSGCPGDPSRA